MWCCLIKIDSSKFGCRKNYLRFARVEKCTKLLCGKE